MFRGTRPPNITLFFFSIVGGRVPNLIKFPRIYKGPLADYIHRSLDWAVSGIYRVFPEIGSGSQEVVSSNKAICNADLLEC